MNKLNAIIIVVLLLGSIHCFSQRLENYPFQEKPKSQKENSFNLFKDRLFFGGGIGFAVANSQILLDLSPVVGIKLNDRFSTGIGVTYKYYRFNNYDVYGTDLINNIVGVSVLGRANIYAGLYAKVEYEYLNIFQTYKPARYDSEWADFHSLFVGGGYSTQISGRSSAFVEVLFNLNDTPYSPYTNPVIRVGILVGI